MTAGQNLAYILPAHAQYHLIRSLNDALQAERRKIEADPETCDPGERIEHITTVLLNVRSRRPGNRHGQRRAARATPVSVKP